MSVSMYSEESLRAKLERAERDLANIRTVNTARLSHAWWDGFWTAFLAVACSIVLLAIAVSALT